MFLLSNYFRKIADHWHVSRNCISVGVFPRWLHFRSWLTFEIELAVEDRGNTLARNHFRKWRPSTASFQPQDILRLTRSWHFTFEAEFPWKQLAVDNSQLSTNFNLQFTHSWPWTKQNTHMRPWPLPVFTCEFTFEVDSGVFLSKVRVSCRQVTCKWRGLTLTFKSDSFRKWAVVETHLIKQSYSLD